MQPPVIAAVRVPPSACSTSQSIVTVTSPPRAAMSTTLRSERPTRRWISCVRPFGRPDPRSRGGCGCGSPPAASRTRRSPSPDRSRAAMRHVLVYVRRAQHARVAQLEDAAAHRVLEVVPGDSDGRSASAARPSVRTAINRPFRPVSEVEDVELLGDDDLTAETSLAIRATSTRSLVGQMCVSPSARAPRLARESARPGWRSCAVRSRRTARAGSPRRARSPRHRTPRDAHRTARCQRCMRT